MSGASSPPPIRLVVRLLLEFMVAAMPPLSRWQEGDLVRGIVFLAIMQAGRPRFAELARRGVLAWPRSDDALKPVSVNSIAASLGLPYETARRQVQRLTAAGLVCRVEAQGVIVPESVLQAEAFAAYAAEIHALFLKMIRGLRAIGFDFDSFSKGEIVAADDDGGEPPGPDAALRHVVVDFMLRLVECGLAAHDNDMTRAFVFSAIMSANAEPYTDQPGAAWDFATLDQSPPEARRRPITVRALSVRIGMPYETTRRSVAAMLRDKDIVRTDRGGLINPQVSPRDARLQQAGAVMLSRFVQFVGDLKRLGFSFETLALEAKKHAA
jgi:DNA-binding transcriptional regulator YhcF (GntR family)